MVFQQSQVRRLARRLDERARHLAAGRVAGMENPPVRVAAFLAELKMAVFPVERNAVIHQIVDRRRAFVNNRPHRGFLAEPGTGIERIGDVKLLGIPGIAQALGQHRGDSALRPRGVGLIGVPFRDHDHRSVSRRPQGKGKPGNAGADHQEICCHVGRA